MTTFERWDYDGRSIRVTDLLDDAVVVSVSEQRYNPKTGEPIYKARSVELDLDDIRALRDYLTDLLDDDELERAEEIAARAEAIYEHQRALQESFEQRIRQNPML